MDLSATLTNASRLGANAGILLHAVENRAELAAIEMEEARARLERVALWAVLAAVTGLLAGFTLILVVAAAFWDTDYRVLSLVITALVLAGTAGAAGWLARQRWRACPLFPDLRKQLSKDCACLQEVLAPDNGTN